MPETIPVIDIADYLPGRPRTLAAVAAQVRDALMMVGFFVLTGHDDQLIECPPTCTSADNPRQWLPITYAEWQAYWSDANYDPKVQRDVA